MITTVAAAVWLFAAAPACAQKPSPWEKLRIGDAVKSIKFGGDLRLRNDGQMVRGAGTNDRNRFRLRLRVGTEVEFAEGVSMNLRLATGAGEQTSTNQSATQLSSQKDFRVDLMFVRWAPAPLKEGSGFVAAGRMINSLWRVYSSDLIWDDDFNPEGFAQGVEWGFPDMGLAFFINALQMVADEDSTSPKNQWLFSQQAGLEARLPLESRLRLAGAYHKWSDENRSSFSTNKVNDGNRRTAVTSAGILTNAFGVGELTGQLSRAFGKTPLVFQATLARNLRARSNLAGPRARDGYQFGFILGKAAAKGSWETAYFRKYAETDVTVADVSDSDFGDGGTNRQGHIFWLAYAPVDWMTLKARYLVTDVVDRGFPPGDKAINRYQIDMQLRF